jgi:hypothetical protein
MAKSVIPPPPPTLAATWAVTSARVVLRKLTVEICVVSTIVPSKLIVLDARSGASVKYVPYRNAFCTVEPAGTSACTVPPVPFWPSPSAE